jgi:uncharacterized membrane protein YjjP (DUF1212 family)
VVVAIACACFGALPGAGLREFGLGLLAAATTVLARNGLNWFFGRPVLLTLAISAFMGTAAAVLAVRLVPCPSPELVVIAANISLLPGVPMVISLGDLINANYVSGLARAAQTFVYLSAIATGMALSLALFRGPALP